MIDVWLLNDFHWKRDISIPNSQRAVTYKVSSPQAEHHSYPEPDVEGHDDKHQQVAQD